MFTRVLIANRGEIAVRIARTCRTLGIPTAAVFSDADRNARHVAACGAAVHIGAAPASESYLSVGRIIDAARASGADAVHAGYGFLSEDPSLPAACADAGLTFIGPPAEVIARFGSKINARRAARDAGVQVVPGGEPADQSEAGIAAAARRTGFPLILKPSAGGGGKGMVTVRDDDELAESIARARREALATAGDGTLYVERRIARPRHVEVQVVADRHGSVLQLGERDCSTQRRHQKVIEESPAPGLSPGLRARLAAAAVGVARHASYENAGTVEFLIDGTGDDAGCYFLEMNTRLQVEHPITELVTGVDLVEAQLIVAAGRPLPWSAAEVAPRGHAIECRVYAEDPAGDYLPQAGTIAGYHEPSGPGIRVDSGVSTGSDVPVHYDPLLAKLAAAGRTREQARRRAHAALGEFAVLGLQTNIRLLRRVLAHEAFVTSDVHTGFLADHEKALIGGEPDEVTLAAIAAAASAVQSKHNRRTSAGSGAGADRHPPGDAVRDARTGVWSRLAGWRLGDR
ncbi:MAG: acetyl/propionyl-CoA carboxylase subunit alpha [Acidobacteria bacterium]|nr:acetyl/propionyl-CoA carboxylase subunit alpha [Acidobacteriota bacterium]